MKKKKKLIIFVTLGVSLFLLITAIVIPIIIFKSSWWWFWSIFIVVGTGWGVYGLIELVKKLNTPEQQIARINVSDAVLKEIDWVKNDINNGDNLIVGNVVLGRYGNPSEEPTPILLIVGYGSELNQRRVTIKNMNNPDKEVTRVINPDEVEIEKLKQIMAENPSEKIMEETIQSFKHGMPITTTKTTIPSSNQKREEQEKKELEEKNAV